MMDTVIDAPTDAPRASDVYDLHVVAPRPLRRALRWLVVVTSHAVGGSLHQPGGHRVEIRDRRSGETMAIHVEGMDEVAADHTARLFHDHEHRTAADFEMQWIGASERP